MFADTDVTARIGLLVPPPNVVMEGEFYRSLPRDIALHTSHMYRSSSEVTVDGQVEMARNAGQAALTIKMTRPDVIVFGCTSASFIKGLGWDEEVSRIVSDAAGVPALTTSAAVVRCLQSIGARRIAVATPYTDEINAREADFLGAHGFDLRSLEGLKIRDSVAIGRVPLQTAYDLALRADRSDADALFISCTNLRTLEAIGPLESALGKPVVSSNLASLWLALDRIGAPQRFAFGESRLLEWQRLAV